MIDTIDMTESAATKLHELRRNDPEKAVLRLYVAGKSCCNYRYGLAFDASADEADSVREVRGIRVAVDPESREHVEGATIDWVETPQGSGFSVSTPKAAGGGCACGR